MPSGLAAELTKLRLCWRLRLCQAHSCHENASPDITGPFSRMRSKGSRFTGGLGVEACARHRATVRNRSEPFGTVRNRPDPPGYRAVWPCLWRVLQQWSLLEVPASFRVAGMALCDIPTCFITCRKSFCVAGALLLYTFVLFSAFFVAGAALWRPPSFRVAGTALQTCRVACFCESHCQGCVKW